MVARLRSALAPTLLTLLTLLTLGATSGKAETGALCTNGLDDDVDGLIDCDDPGCGASARVGPLDLRVSLVGTDRTPLLSWSGADAGITVVDLASGELAELSSPMRGCAFDSVLEGPSIVGTSLLDPRPGPGSAWFLVRAHSACASGSFGTDSSGADRVLDRDCRPGDALAGCDGGPMPGVVSAWTDCDASNPLDLTVHLTNDTAQPLRWWWAACPSMPSFDVLDGVDSWQRHRFCVLCADGWGEWIDLAPGEDVVADAGTWTSCLLPGTYRAWFIVAGVDCTVGGDGALEACPDARIVATPPFVITP